MAEADAGRRPPPSFDIGSVYFFSTLAAFTVDSSVLASASATGTWFSIMWLPTIAANTSGGIAASVTAICCSVPERVTVY